MYRKLKKKINEIRNYYAIKRSGVFDREYYLRNNLDVARSCEDPFRHFIRHGWREGRRPNASFDTQMYLESYPDMASNGINFLYQSLTGDVAEKNGSCQGADRGQPTLPLRVAERSLPAEFRRCTSLTLVIDHNLGGGANHYRNQLIKDSISQSQDILLLHNVLAYGKDRGYKLTLFSMGKQYLFECEKTGDLFSVLDSLPLQQVFYNSLVYYSDLNRFLEKMVCWSKSGTDIVVALHDFFPICPSFNLIGSDGVFCRLPSISHCPSCLNAMRLDHLEGPVDLLSYKTLWQDVLKAASEIQCFSESSQVLLKKAYPLINSSKIKIVPHSMDYFKCSRLNLKSARNKHLKIAVIGDVFSIAKGTHFMKRFADYLLKQDPEAKIYIFGKYDGTNSNIRHMGRYSPQDLPALMETHQIDIAFLPSVWPETFSYLTSELIMIGMPLVCFDMGAQAEKVRRYDYGDVIPEITESKALETIYDLCRKVYG